MFTVSPQTTLGEFVAGCPARVQLLEGLGIEGSGDPALTLEEACAGKGRGASPALAAAWPPAQPPAAQGPADLRRPPDPEAHSFGELCDQLVAAVHVPLRAELSRLEALARRVAAVHGGAHPELRVLATTLGDLADGVQTHLLKEEVMLFPALRHLEAGRVAAAPFGAHLQAPLELLEGEHRAAEAALGRLRDLSGGFTAPGGACASWRGLLAGLAALERGLQRQIDLENRLFARARAAFGRLGA